MVSAIKQQVRKHRDKERSRRSTVEEKDVITAVFKTLGIAPELALKRVKPSNVSRGRSLVAWLWVEQMGRPQVMIADAMSVRRTAVSKMLSKLRREGLNKDDELVLKEVFEKLTGEESTTKTSMENGGKELEPRVIVLKRNRAK